MSMNIERNGRPIYLLYACNARGEWNDMRQIGVSTSSGGLCPMIASCVFKGNMEYRGEKRLEGFRLFHRDYRNDSLQLSP
jgi:hypothetical protein